MEKIERGGMMDRLFREQHGGKLAFSADSPNSAGDGLPLFGVAHIG
jgi:hypothetical protein